MTHVDTSLMLEALEWAKGCNPKKASIPRVGAIIAVENEVIGRGRRGTGSTGDDEHAEWNAIESVREKARLPSAMLYTTLEPCTREVRTNELECCTELILQHKIQKVFVGILDPNQGVTGKGLWRLQDSGIEVELFPHDLAQQIRAINADFIRSQQILGATIISPSNGETLRTYLTQGKQTIRFKSLNPPGANNYLLSFREGLCWPQPGTFREVKQSIWEIDAYFGATGDHTLHLVTAVAMGRTLVEYYRKVVQLNTQRTARLKEKIDAAHLDLLGGDYPGIPMNGLPKGFRSEASVAVTVAAKPKG
jgi:pyrimidine deaminase RibD-like protein